MDNEKLIAVSLLVGDRTYRVRVSVQEEEQLRKTVKFINAKVLEYKANIPGKDMQDYVSMALLWYATQPIGGATDSLLAQNALQEQLERMEQLVDKALA